MITIDIDIFFWVDVAIRATGACAVTADSTENWSKTLLSDEVKPITVYKMFLAQG